MKYYISFTCAHKTKDEEQLDLYSQDILKKYEIDSFYTMEYREPALKFFFADDNENVKPLIDKLRDDGYIFTNESMFELHRPYVIKSIDDLKRIFAGVLRTQVLMHLNNKDYYGFDCKMFDNKILEKIQEATNIDDFCKLYLKQLSSEPLADQRSIKSLLKNKGLKHSGWCDVIPLLRPYYKIKYESSSEPNNGIGTFLLRLKVLHVKKDETAVDYDLYKKDLYVMLKNMQNIMS